MQNKRDSYNRDDLLASSQGELFGPGYPQLPAPNMLMMDRSSVVSMSLRSPGSEENGTSNQTTSLAGTKTPLTQ